MPHHERMVPRSDRGRAARRWEPSVHATASTEGRVDAREGCPYTLTATRDDYDLVLEVTVTQTGVFCFFVFKPQMTPRRRRQPETPEGRRQDTSNHTPNGKLHIQSHIHRWGLHTSERQTDIPKVHPQTHTRARGWGGEMQKHNHTSAR